MPRSLIGLLLLLACAYNGFAETLPGCPPPDDNHFDAFAEADPNLPFAEGLLWRIEKNGQELGHLFGTIHLDYPAVTRLPPLVRLSFARSKTLLMETVLDPQAHRTYLQGIYQQDKSAADALSQLPEDLQKRARQLLSDYGLRRDRQDGLKAWAIFSTLGRPKPTSGIVQDEVLRQLAEQGHKAVHGMETMQGLIAMLDSVPEQDQMVILRDTLCQHDKLMQGVRDLVEVYAARNLAALLALNNQPHDDEAVFERFMQIMLDDRNDLMIEAIKQHLQKGGVFAAVGAMHLPGRRGLLQRLVDAGYQVEPVF